MLRLVVAHACLCFDLSVRDLETLDRTVLLCVQIHGFDHGSIRTLPQHTVEKLVLHGGRGCVRHACFVFD
jgi:hypothetical protein